MRTSRACFGVRTWSRRRSRSRAAQADAIAGLTPDPAAAPIACKRSTRTWLTFPAQEHRLSIGEVTDPATAERAGEIVEIEGARLLLHRGPKFDDVALPSALIGPSPLDTRAQRAALTRVAQDLRDQTWHYPAAGALLRRDLPAVIGTQPGSALVSGHVSVAEAARVTLAL